MIISTSTELSYLLELNKEIEEDNKKFIDIFYKVHDQFKIDYPEKEDTQHGNMAINYMTKVLNPGKDLTGLHDYMHAHNKVISILMKDEEYGTFEI